MNCHSELPLDLCDVCGRLFCTMGLSVATEENEEGDPATSSLCISCDPEAVEPSCVGVTQAGWERAPEKGRSCNTYPNFFYVNQPRGESDQ